MTRRLIVAITGAAGAVYGVRLLQVLRTVPDVETHLMVTPAGWMNVEQELAMPRAEVEALAHVVHAVRDVGATVASGSFATEGMVIAPCSMRTLAAIATGLADNLVTRAAYVHLKERRPLVLVPREAPLPLPTLEAMVKAAQAGATILPASPGFYTRPQSIDDLLGFVTQRVLDLLGIEADRAPRWKEA